MSCTYMSIYKSPISGAQFVNQPQEEGCLRKAACRNTCTATPECKGIDIYVALMKLNMLERDR